MQAGPNGEQETAFSRIVNINKLRDTINKYMYF